MKFPRTLKILVALAVFAWQAQGFAQDKKNDEKGLPFPPLADTWQSLDRHLDAVTGEVGKIYTFSDGRPYMVSTPVAKGFQSTREAKFGEITASKRHKGYAEGHDVPTVRGAAVFERELVVMNSTRLSLISVFKKDMTETMRRTIALDMMRPPRDASGEAPNFEVVEYRNRFKKEFAKTPTLPFAGMNKVPATWRGGKNELFILSHLSGFNLLILACDSESNTQCQATRGCFTSFDKGVDTTKLRGVSAMEDKKLILVGDPDHHQLLVMKFSSCHSVVQIGRLPLPAKVKKLRNLWVDDQGSLWVVTDEPDWYHNASLFSWSKETWTNAIVSGN